MADPSLYVPSGNGEWGALDAGEHEIARHCGAMMRAESLAAGLREQKIMDDGKAIQEDGVIGDRVVAKQLMLYWPHPCNRFRRLGDLPGNVEVRTVSVDRYGLRIRDNDPNDRRCVLVVVLPTAPYGPYRIPGWYYAGSGKRPEWRMDPRDAGRPMYAVPQLELKPLTELRYLLHREVIAFDRIAAALAAIGTAMPDSSSR